MAEVNASSNNSMAGVSEWVSVAAPDTRGRRRTEPASPTGRDTTQVEGNDERARNMSLDSATPAGASSSSSGTPGLWSRTMNGMVSGYYSLKTSASWFLNTNYTGLERLARDKPIWVLGQCHVRTQVEAGASSAAGTSSRPTSPQQAIAKQASNTSDRSDDVKEGSDGGDDRLLRHLNTVLWFTYRKDFPPIAGSWQTSDCGWGCMLRTGQMLLAQTLIRHELGEEWREGQGKEAEYKQIISYFADSPNAPCSVHAIAVAGERFETRIGNWFGPTTAAFALQDIVHRNAALYTRGLRVYVATQTTVFIDRVEELCTMPTPPLRRDREAVIGDTSVSGTPNGWAPVLILIPLMLGVERQMSERYHAPILRCFQMSQCVGIAGGQPRSSLFFIGYQNLDVVYLDPHAVQAAYNPAQPETQGRVHETTLRLVPVAQLDPCCVLGFYCKDRESFDSWVSLVRGSVATGEASLFTVQDRDTHGMGKLDGSF